MISSFSGPHRFLSNFYPAKVTVTFWAEADNEVLGVRVVVPTVEHAYQASKAARHVDFEKLVDAVTPHAAKRLGRQVALRVDWNDIRLHVMEELLEQKFSDRVLRQQLLDTGDEQLVEGNYWGDAFWGVTEQGNGVGENHLGKLLMNLRAFLATKA